MKSKAGCHSEGPDSVLVVERGIIGAVEGLLQVLPVLETCEEGEAVEGALRRLLGFGCRHPFPEPAEGMGSQMDAPCLQPLRQALEIGRLLEPVGGATAPVRDDFFYLSFHVF